MKWKKILKLLFIMKKRIMRKVNDYINMNLNDSNE